MLKMQLFSLTEVPPTGQKILVKGGQLKDETALSTLNLKANQTLIMMGKPGESSEKTQSIEKPKEQHRFIEDMTEAEAARSEGATPSGLVNLGNTCYLNSSIQVLRAIPDLRHLVKSAPNTAAAGQRNLTTSLRDLFTSLSETQGAVSPVFLWTSLQAANEQFTERNRNGTGFAQQDAEEAWSTILQNMKTNLVLKGEDGESASFVDKYMRGRFESVMTCTDADAKEKGEMPIESSEDFMKLSCHIDKDVNHLRDGITAGLHEMIDKHSPTLDRNATYEKQSRIARLPKYLTVHFVRFFWKRDSRIKAKIMRKVTFPEELDVVEFCSDDLKKKLIPIRDNIRDIRKEELDLERSRKRQKIKHMQSEEEAKADTPGGFGIQKSTKEPLQKKKDKETEKEASQTTYKTDADYDAEHVQHLQELKSNLKKLLAENASLADSDPLANKT
ncbi:deubiquitinating enzyme, partial [Ascosphaera atra]